MYLVRRVPTSTCFALHRLRGLQPAHSIACGGIARRKRGCEREGRMEAALRLVRPRLLEQRRAQVDLRDIGRCRGDIGEM